MPRVLGYAEPLSVAPGEEIRFMVGTSSASQAERVKDGRMKASIQHGLEGHPIVAEGNALGTNVQRERALKGHPRGPR